MRTGICRVAGVGLALLLAGATSVPAVEPDLRLVTAAARQDKTAVRTLLKSKVDVNTARADGATALLFAAHWDDAEMVELLLRAGANVNAADDHGVTPLAQSSENRNATMAERLVSGRA